MTINRRGGMSMRKRLAAACVVVAAVCGTTSTAPASAARTTGVTQRVSVSPAGAQADGFSHYTATDDTGRYVAFNSVATNLLSTPDTNGDPDVFLKDRVTGSVERISVASNGEQADGGSWGVSMSGDARFVAFASGAVNLTDLDRGLLDTALGNNFMSVYVRDRAAGTTTLISTAVDQLGERRRAPGYMPSISDDGCVVAYADEPEAGTGYVYDCRTGMTTRIPENDDVASPDVTGDGRYVAFGTWSAAGERSRAMVFSVETGQLEEVSVSSAGEPANEWSMDVTISDDGRMVAFASWATNFGNYAPGANFELRTYVRDRSTGTTSLASMNSQGVPTYGFHSVISGDGRSIVFKAYDHRLWRRGEPEGGFYLRRLGVTGTVFLTVDNKGKAANDSSYWPSTSHDAGVVAFISAATNLVPGDTNGAEDAFVRVP